LLSAPNDASFYIHDDGCNKTAAKYRQYTGKINFPVSFCVKSLSVDSHALPDYLYTP